MPLMSFQELADAAKGADLGSLPRNIARVARDTYCDIYARAPEWLTNGPAPFGNPSKALADNLCRRVPPDTPVPSRPLNIPGGQCPVEYEFAITSYETNLNNQDVVSVGSFRSAGVGPLTFDRQDIASAQQGGGFLYSAQVFANNAQGGRPSAVTGTQARKVNEVTVQLRRKDGQPDSCGNGQPRPTPVPTPPQLDRQVPVPVPGGPPVVLPVIIPVGVFINPQIQVKVGPFDINIGPNEVNIKPTVNFNPEFNIRPNEPSGSGGGSRPTINPDLTINGGGGGECPDPCPPAIVFEDVTVQVGVCTREEGQWKFKKEDRTFKVIKEQKLATQEEFKQLLPLVRAECQNRNKRVPGNPTLLSSGRSSSGDRTVVISLPDACLSVYLDIVGPLPPGVTLYSLQTNEEEQGRIGNISLAIVEGPSVGAYQDSQPGWIWTRRTWLDVGEKATKGRSIRLNLKPGIEWQLYDSGERVPTKEYT